MRREERVVNKVALDSVGLEDDINGVEYEVGVVLSLAKMELILFINACRVPCFTFLTSTILIKDQCFRSCCRVFAQHQGTDSVCDTSE